MEKQLDITGNNRKKITFFLFVGYALFSLMFLIRFAGYYGYDEMYHVSAADADFFAATNYKRAPYLNLMIRGLTVVFGRNHYVYKLIPYGLGLISFSCFLYLVYRLTEHTYSIACFALIMCTHSLLILNHMYIRMYVCDEAVIAVLALILFLIAQVSSRSIRIVLYFLYFAAASVLWLFQPAESSSFAVLATGIAAFIINYAGVRIIPYLRERKRLIPTLIVCGIILIVVMAGVVAIRLSLIPCPGFLSKIVVNRHGAGISQPVFIGYFLTKGIFLTIGMIGFGRLLLTKEIKNNLLGIYLLGLLPLIAYCVLYFDQRLFRVFAAFLPVLIFVTVLWLDQFPAAKKNIVRIVGVAALTSLFSYPRITMHVIEFYKLPYSVGEHSFDNYGGLLAQASQEIQNGRKCFCIWANKHVEAAFADFAWDADLCIDDDLNNRNAYTEEDFQEILDYFKTTQEPYVLVVGANSARKIDYWITPDFMNTLRAEYSYVEYPQDAYLFYIN